MIDPNKVIDDAQQLLKKAVNVLEEEIAAGILAAKKLEKKVINVDEVRDMNPEDLMSRIRRDTHDAVDILLDAFSALTSHFGSLTDTLNKTKADAAGNNSNGAGQNNTGNNAAQSNTGNGATQSKGNGAAHANGTQPKSAPAIPVVRNEKPARPGTTIEVPIMLTNDSKDGPITVTLNRSELIGPGGTRIAAKSIRLAPRSFELAPLQQKEVVIKINIPESCKPGAYSSLIQDDSNPEIRVIITIDVEQITV